MQRITLWLPLWADGKFIRDFYGDAVFICEPPAAAEFIRRVTTAYCNLLLNDRHDTTSTSPTNAAPRLADD